MKAMIRSLALVGVLTAGWAASTLCVQAAGKIFLFAGQSNMSGLGVWTDLTAAEKASVANSLVFAADPNHAPPIGSPTYFQYWLPPQGSFINYSTWYSGMSWNVMNPGQYTSGNEFGPEFTCARDLASGLGEQIYIAKYSLAGTGLDSSFQTLYGTWYPSEGDPGSPAEYTKSLYHSMVQWAKNARTAARAIDPAAEIAGFFWLQGETDAFYQSTANLYGNNLTSFIAQLRSDLGVSTLPVLIGRITTAWSYASPVRNWQVYVPGECDGEHRRRPLLRHGRRAGHARCQWLRRRYGVQQRAGAISQGGNYGDLDGEGRQREHGDVHAERDGQRHRTAWRHGPGEYDGQHRPRPMLRHGRGARYAHRQRQLRERYGVEQRANGISQGGNDGDLVGAGHQRQHDLRPADCDGQ